jgi:hypothetical protein
MERIYRESRMTVGWLGLGSESGEDAIEFLHVPVRNRKQFESQK